MRVNIYIYMFMIGIVVRTNISIRFSIGISGSAIVYHGCSSMNISKAYVLVFEVVSVLMIIGIIIIVVGASVIIRKTDRSPTHLRKGVSMLFDLI